MENVEIQNVEARRSFLKKVAYVAPAVVALGALSAPMSAQASTFHNHTQSVPAGTLVSEETITTKDGTNIVLKGASNKIPTASYGNYELTGAQVKEAANAGDGSWTWVNNLFGGTSKWLGV